MALLSPLVGLLAPCWTLLPGQTSVEPQPRFRNTGLALHINPNYPFSRVLVAGSGDTYLALVSERAQGGKDLTGDGDTADAVYFLLHGDDRPRNLRLAPALRELPVPGTRWSVLSHRGGTTLFWASEAETGRDLDQDGDLLDGAAYAIDSLSGTVADLHDDTKTFAPDARGRSWLIGDRLYDASTGLARALPLTILFPEYYEDEHTFAGIVSELQNGVDLDGDGDMDGYHLAFVDPSTARVRVLPDVTGVQGSLPGKAFASEIDENSLGRDVNGNGRATDVLPCLVDPLSLLVTMTGWQGGYPYGLARHNTNGAVSPQYGWRPAPLLPGGYLLSYEQEQLAGEDLDGDGAISNGFGLKVWDVGRGQGRTTGLAINDGSSRIDLTDSATLLVVEERPGTDWNGDGDFLDEVVLLYDASRGRSYPTVLPPSMVAGAIGTGTHSYFQVPESFLRMDVNGDGDLMDSTTFAFDRTRRSFVDLGFNLRIPLPWPEDQSERWDVFFAYEAWANADLNGDGDLGDATTVIFDKRHDRAILIPLAVRLYLPVFSGDQVAVAVSESYHGQQDLNGDGDVDDDVLFLVDLRDRP